MALTTLKVLHGLNLAVVKVMRDPDLGEFQVQVPGSPDATYFTDDKADALSTANVMLADMESRIAAARTP